MKYIFIILISLFISLPSFANPSGKGIICECVDCKEFRNKRKIGIMFTGDYANRYMFDDIKDIISIKKSHSWIYTTRSDHIEFTIGGVVKYYLNRKSLKLNLFKGNAVTGNLKELATYQCKVIVDEDEFKKEIDNLKNYYQKELDLELKDNKI